MKMMCCRSVVTIFIFFFFFLVFSAGGAVRDDDEYWEYKSAPSPSSSSSKMNDDDIVSKLPGQPEVGFLHYAGYITVNEKNGRALFYWFYEAMSLPQQKPLVLWLNGGPGCSSVGYGATQEIGPFLLLDDGHEMRFNNFSWNKEANILFLESPIGVGFSYSNTSTDYKNIGDNFTANDAYSFLENWFLKYPWYKTRPFYIAGESYAGKYIPELAELIHERNNNSMKNYVNLKGILLGNPETSNSEDWRGMVDYAWGHAIISDQTHNIISTECDFNSNNTWDNEECSQAVDHMLKTYNEIDMYSLYTPICNIPPPHDHHHAPSQSSLSRIIKPTPSNMMGRMLGGYDPCLDRYAKVFYNRPDVQKALHVSDGIHMRNWSICNQEIFNGWSDSRPSVTGIYKKLIEAEIRIWVYSGDTDGRVPFLSTRYSLNTLGLPITNPWRPWYNQNEVSGWVEGYEGVTFATVRGAGHAVPCFKPSSSLLLFSAFLHNQSLPSTRLF